MRGHGWQIQLRLMTLSTARDLGRWQRAYSRLSEAHTEGNIHNTLVKPRLQTQSLIIKKKTPCIMTTNLLCNVHVTMTQRPPSSILNLFLSWGYLYSHQTSAMQISKYWHRHVDTCRGRRRGGGSHSASSHLPQSVRTGGGNKWSLEEKLKCNLEERPTSRKSHIFYSEAGHSTSPKTEGSSKGTWELGVIFYEMLYRWVHQGTPVHW